MKRTLCFSLSTSGYVAANALLTDVMTAFGTFISLWPSTSTTSNFGSNPIKKMFDEGSILRSNVTMVVIALAIESALSPVHTYN